MVDGGSEARSASAATASAEAPEKTLGLTPQAYASRFNHSLQRLKLPYRLDASRVAPGTSKDVLLARFGKHTEMVMTVSKSSGQIMEISPLVTAGGSEASGQDSLLIASAAMSAAAVRTVLNRSKSLMEGMAIALDNAQISATSLPECGTVFLAKPI